jgi:transcriptional regulator with GAF, ATPase, and Fis domain
MMNRAYLLHQRGRWLASLRQYLDARRHARRLERMADVAMATASAAALLLEGGRTRYAVRLFERAARIRERVGGTGLAHGLCQLGAALIQAGRPSEGEQRLDRAATLPGAERTPDARLAIARARLRGMALAGDIEKVIARTGELLEQGGSRLAAYLAADRAEFIERGGESGVAEVAWRTALRYAARTRDRSLLPRIRVALAAATGARGAWRHAEAMLTNREIDLLSTRTPLRARALLIRAQGAIVREEPAVAVRLLEEAVAVANRCDDAALRADVYEATASMLEEGAIQRLLRRPTAAASAALLEVVREIWALYGNEAMLRKIDLHLAELPRAAADPLAGPDAERLVKVLHIAREMNRAFDRDQLLALILDRAIEITGAERGFVVLLNEGREEVHLARNLDREAVSEPERKMSTQIVKEVVRTGRIVRTENAEEDTRFEEYLSVRQLHLKSLVAVPFRSGRKTIGALYLDNRFRIGSFTEQDERILELFADQAVAAIDKATLIRELEAQRAAAEEAMRRLKSEYKRKGGELKVAQKELAQHRRSRGWGFDKLVARSVTMQAVVREAKRIAASNLPVLLSGESGTGKEMLARAMHLQGPRRDGAFVPVNCSAFAEQLLEAELFGHVRGSFTGADRDRPGLFEEADGGTIFLDEVAEMSLPVQVKLLRTLEVGEVRRIGESGIRTVDVRVIAATNVELEQAIRKQKFREDLYYRLSGFVLWVPPLRERLEDGEPLAYAFVGEAGRVEGRPDLTISTEAIARLESFSWSGNVREMRNVIMRAAVTASENVIGPEDVKIDSRSPGVLPGYDPGHADHVLRQLEAREIALNPRQQTAVSRVLIRGKLYFGEYKQLFRVSKSTTARDLEEMIELGLLEKRGKTRAVIYLPGARLQEIARSIGKR